MVEDIPKKKKNTKTKKMNIYDLLSGQELPDEGPKWYEIVILYYEGDLKRNYILDAWFQDDRYTVCIEGHDNDCEDFYVGGGHDEIEHIKKWYEMKKRREKIIKITNRIGPVELDLRN